MSDPHNTAPLGDTFSSILIPQHIQLLVKSETDLDVEHTLENESVTSDEEAPITANLLTEAIDKQAPRTSGSRLLEAALAYHRNGLPVVPVNGKLPTVPWKQYIDRMQTEDEVRAMFDGSSNQAQTGLSMVNGPAAWQEHQYLCVIEIEQRFRGEAEPWLDVHLPDWRNSRLVESGGGSLHIYVTSPNPVQTSKIAWGELRGAGSTTVLPPSTHPNGKRYSWLSKGAQLGLDPYTLPLPGLKRDAPGYELLAEGVVREGEGRNIALASLGGLIRNAGFDVKCIEAALLGVNGVQCVPPLPQDEVRNIAKSVSRYEPRVNKFDSGHSTPLGEGADKKRIQAHEWLVRLLSELSSQKAGADIDGIWGLYLVPGTTVTFTGLPKVGKTTLLSHLFRALDGTAELFCGQKVRGAKVLVITEEGERHWAMRRDALKLGDHIAVVVRPFMGRAGPTEWGNFIQWVAGHARLGGYDLIVFDSLPNLWGVRDENDAAQVLAALTPLNNITQTGACVLLIAHPKKSDGSEGRATRGTGAISGFVDVMIELRRYDPGHLEDTRRVISAYSRFDDTPQELVVHFDKAQSLYTAVGRKSDANSADRLSTLLALLPAVPPGLLLDEILGKWPDEAAVTRPGDRTLRRDLEVAVEKGRVATTGEGVKGNPLRYYLRGSTTPPGAVTNAIPDTIDSYRCQETQAHSDEHPPTPLPDIDTLMETGNRATGQLVLEENHHTRDQHCATASNPPNTKGYLYVTTEKELARVMEQLQQSTPQQLAVDVETTGLHPHSGDKLVFVQLYHPSMPAIIIDCRRLPLPLVAGQLSGVLCSDSWLKVGHNIGFDYGFLFHALGLEMKRLYDTMLAELLLTAGLHPDVDLKTVANKYIGHELNKDVRKEFEVLGDNDPTPELLEYAADDVRVLHSIMKCQIERLKAEGLMDVALLEMKVVPAIVEARIHGVLIDRQRWMANVERLAAEADKLGADLQEQLQPFVEEYRRAKYERQCEEQKARAASGGKKLPIPKLPIGPINLGSYDQLCGTLPLMGIPLTVKQNGKAATDHDSLERIAGEYPIIRQLLDWRGYQKLVDAFGENFLDHLDSNSRLHPDFHQIGTATGRMSCTEPNLQQVPANERGEEFRRCFVAPPGYKIISVDYSQIELALLHDHAGQKETIEAINDGLDLHSLTASGMFNLPYDEVVAGKEGVHKQKRQAAKAINFGIPYGLSAAGLSRDMGMPLPEAAQYIKAYFRANPGVRAWLDSTARAGLKDRNVATVRGRKRYFAENPYDPRKQRKEHEKYERTQERQMCNHAIQGMSADITKQATVYILEAIRAESLDAKFQMFIHDEIVMVAPDEQAEQVALIMQREMVRAAADLLKHVKPRVEYMIDEHWNH